MKNNNIFWAFLTLLLTITSCGVDEVKDQNNDLSQFKEGVETVNAYVEPFDGEGKVDTKSTLAFSGAFTWQYTDKLMFWPSTDSNFNEFSPGVIGVPYIISNIEPKNNKSYATFVGKGWALKRGVTYYAHIPYSDEDSSSSVNVDYSGQRQMSNASDAHLGAYDYLYSSFPAPSTGDANISFKHLGSMRRFNLSLPEGTTSETVFAGMLLSSANNIFCEKATYDPRVTPVVFEKENSNMTNLIGVYFGENGFSASSSTEVQSSLVITMMMMPTVWKDNEISVILVSDAGKCYKGTFTPDSDINSGTRKEYNITSLAEYTPSFNERCLTFSVSDQDETKTNTISLTNNHNNKPDLEYSYDKVLWEKWDYSPLTITKEKPVYIRGNNPYGFSSDGKWSSFTIGDSTVDVGCSGSVMSLLSYDEDLTTIPCEYCFSLLFSGCTSLTSAPTLPATELTPGCYVNMFKNCSSLTAAPELPATTLEEECYSLMFNLCTKLEVAPELPATEMVKGCYKAMFYECESLTSAPILPATTLAEDCYKEMFAYSGLTSAPALPATTLTKGCYQLMFEACSSLTAASLLPATTLVENCYNGMFHDCTSLSYIKMLATNISASECMTNWTLSVSTTGTFVKNPAATWNVRGENGIPESWETVIDIPNPEMVDLGLSVKWASFNLGASTSEGYGLYYQWGDTQGYGSDVSDGKWFNWHDNETITYKYYGGPVNTINESETNAAFTMTKYNTIASCGDVDNKTVLLAEDDAASAVLGNNWRMPTAIEWEELMNTEYCTWTWTTENGVNGYKVQSKKSGYTDKWIFLPAAGYRGDNKLKDEGTIGYYWSASLNEGTPYCSYYLYFNSSTSSKYDRRRCMGLTIRPVSD